MAIDRTQFNLLVDDAGDSTSGTVVDKNKIQTVLLDPIDALIGEPLALTPTVISTGGGTPTYTTQVGRYTKHNKRVTFTAYIVLATFGTLAAGTITIGGLPVASENNAGNVSAITVGYWDALTTAVVNITALIQPNTSVIQLFKVTAATTGLAAAALTKADLTATWNLVISGQYISA
jgi:hypothetical protein